MEIENLNTFCIVAYHKTFVKAAELLNITQSGVSRRIQSLESELGVQLLVRNPQAVSLTKAGKYFLPYAERTVQIYREGHKRMIEGGSEEKVIIAAPPAASSSVLPNVLKQFHSKHRVPVSVLSAHSQDVFDMLNDKTIQIGFTTVAFPSSQLNYELVFTEKIVFVGHPLLIDQYFNEGVLGQQRLPVILTNLKNVNIYPWDSINQYFISRPEFDIIMDSFYFHLIEKLARLGVGFAALPVSLAADGIQKGELKIVPTPDFVMPTRPIYMAHSKHMQMTDSIHHFMKVARQVLANDSFTDPLFQV